MWGPHTIFILLALGAPANFSKNSSRETSKQTFSSIPRARDGSRGGMWGMHPPHQPFLTMLWINKVFYNFEPLITMGANPWRDVSPPIIRQYPPQYFHVPKLGVSAGDDLFLAFTSFWAKKIGIWERYDLIFWSSLRSGQKLGHLQTCQFS